MSAPRRLLSAAATCLPVLLAAASDSGGEELRLVVRGGEVDMTDVPVSVEVKLPGSLARAAPERISARLRTTRPPANVPGQVVRGPDGKTRLWWIVPDLEAHSTTSWAARFSRTPPRRSECFAWKDARDRHLDLTLVGRGVTRYTHVTRYVYERDTSTPGRAHETYKVYHHVFNLKGDGFITKGPHGQYTHHRGIYIGWNKVRFEQKQYDLWHMKPKAVQLHQKFLQKSAGPVLARSTALVHWKTADDGRIILSEERETTFFRQTKPALVFMDFVSRLTAVTADVDLSGDPEHAGFQFRPSNAISGKDEKGKGKVPLGTNRKAKYLFHADGANPKKQKDLPWVAMNYALGGQPYSILHMNHVDNLKGAVWSAYRPYGRFGCWTKTSLKKGEKLTLKYRLWIGAAGMPSREECAARYAGFVRPPEVAVRR